MLQLDTRLSEVTQSQIGGWDAYVEHSLCIQSRQTRRAWRL